MTDLRPGDHFYITGPLKYCPRDGKRKPTWWKGKHHGWQPRAWWTAPEDAPPNAQPVFPETLHIDFTDCFEALEVRTWKGTVSARVTITERDVWINVAQQSVNWVVKWWTPSSCASPGSAADMTLNPLPLSSRHQWGRSETRYWTVKNV